MNRIVFLYGEYCVLKHITIMPKFSNWSYNSSSVAEANEKKDGIQMKEERGDEQKEEEEG